MGVADERAHSRLVVDKTLLCIVGQSQYPVFLYNLSQSGCMFVTPNRDLSLGDCMVLKLFADIEVCGQVVWVSGGNAGVKFERLLHETAVRHLGFTPRHISFEEWEPHDRFGRPLPELRSVASRGSGIVGL